MPTASSQEKHESSFTQRLRVAHAQAVEAGDLIAAAAVAEALRAEGAILEELPRTGGASPSRSSPKAPIPPARFAFDASTAATDTVRATPFDFQPAVSQSSSSTAPAARAAVAGEAAASPLKPPRVGGNVSPQQRWSRGNSEVSASNKPQHTGLDKALGASLRRGGAKTARQMRHLEALIADQLSHSMAPEASAEPPQGLAQLGRLRVGAPQNRLLEQAAAQLQQCRAADLHSVRNLKIERSGTDGCGESIPASDLPSPARAALHAWAHGQISGARCLLEVEAAAPTAPQSAEAGRPSWSAITALCGLAGGCSFASESRCPVWMDAFGQPPAGALHVGLRAVRAEAQIEEGPLTIEELHLGLRAVELRAKCGSGGGHSSDSGADRFQVQAWRELLKLHLESPASAKADGYTSMNSELVGDRGFASILRQVLSLGAEGVEKEARTVSAEALRAPPPGWEECCKVLAGSARLLREALGSIRTYGAYTALGVAVDAPGSGVKRAYRELCLLHHPDKGGDTAAFQQVRQAYEHILDERKRGVQPPPPPPPPSSQPHRPNSQQSEGRRAPASPRAPQTPRGPQPAAEGGEGQRAPRPRRQRSADPQVRRAPAEDDCGGTADRADAKAAAESCAKSVRELEDLRDQVAQAAERARAASGAAVAAAKVIEDTVRAHCPASGGRLEVDSSAVMTVLEAAPELEAAMHNTAEDAEAAANALSSISSMLVPACGPFADGEEAEQLLGAAMRCSSQSTSASDVASACNCLAEEISETFRQVGVDLADAGRGSEHADFALQLLSSASRRGRDAACDTADASAAAAAAAAAAVMAARSATRKCRAQTGTSGRSKDLSPDALRPEKQNPGAGDDCSSTKEDTPFASRRAEGARASANQRSPPRSPSERGCDGGERGARARGEVPDAGRQSARPRSAGARSSSAGPRGFTEALVQRRLQIFEDMKRLDTEVRSLQRETHEVLLRSPLLLKNVATGELRSRIFSVAGEILQEAARAVVAAPAASPSHFEPLPFLAAAASGGDMGGAICDSRSGVLRLAALLDEEALRSVLTDQFVPLILAGRPPSEADSWRAAVSRAANKLKCWVVSKNSEV